MSSLSCENEQVVVHPHQRQSAWACAGREVKGASWCEIDRSDGSIYVTGSTTETLSLGSTAGRGFVSKCEAPGVSRGFLAKYDQDGAFLWGLTTAAPLPGATCESCAVDSKGDIYAVGCALSPLTVKLTTLDKPVRASIDKGAIYLIKITASGELMWSVGISGVISRTSPNASICINGDDEIFVAGYLHAAQVSASCTDGTVFELARHARSPNTPANVFVVKYRPSGVAVASCQLIGLSGSRCLATRALAAVSDRLCVCIASEGTGVMVFSNSGRRVESIPNAQCPQLLTLELDASLERVVWSESTVGFATSLPHAVTCFPNETIVTSFSLESKFCAGNASVDPPSATVKVRFKGGGTRWQAHVQDAASIDIARHDDANGLVILYGRCLATRMVVVDGCGSSHVVGGVTGRTFHVAFSQSGKLLWHALHAVDTGTSGSCTIGPNNSMALFATYRPSKSRVHVSSPAHEGDAALPNSGGSFLALVPIPPHYEILPAKTPGTRVLVSNLSTDGSIYVEQHRVSPGVARKFMWIGDSWTTVAPITDIRILEQRLDSLESTVRDVFRRIEDIYTELASGKS